MIGKTASDIINILKTYSEESPAEIPSLVRKRVEEDLVKVGVVGLNNLTQEGVLGVLFYLYGTGIIEEEAISKFLDNKRDDISVYVVEFVPSKVETHLVAINVKYVAKTNTTFNKDL